MSIFQKSVINKHLKNLDQNQVEKAHQKFKENYSPSKIEKIKKLTEEEYQDGFLRDLFVDVFGYTLKPDDDYNLAREFKNQGDGKKADGAILKNEKAVAVIELKSTKTKDLKSITEQAFNYKNNQPECKYVITSNFQKLRFYIDYANEFEEFDLFYLQKEEFELLYLILNINSVFSDLPQKLKEETKFHDQEISDKLYKDYSDFKNKLYENLIKNNPGNDKLTLFKKSQKLLDRFLFILFAEDSGLLPPNSISRIIDTYHKLEELDAYKPIYDIYKQYFGYLNIGRKGKTNVDDIPAYNGGLFYDDNLLDNLKIDDEILIKDLLKLSEYDFNTEVDVNILGHIFEHSLSEIEEITAEIEGTTTDKSKSKRKKDGVFYTPKYITQYIVENTIGTLCNEKREKLEIKEIEFDGTYRTKDGNLSSKGKKLYKKLNDYKDWLLSLKIIDPACGSGAFLNQALDFLIQEHKDIDDIIAELTNSALRLFDTEKSILENNLYGVDINEESVEIAKLSLWLRTAHKDRKLSNLNSNIKCGNSLIDDPEFAGNKAFDWNKEFFGIMRNGGFDVVIGNPPYGAEFSKNQKNYYISKFNLSPTILDTYLMFLIEIPKLLCDNGVLGYIIPSTWLYMSQYKIFRTDLISKFEIPGVVLYRNPIFEDATVETCITFLKKLKPNRNSFYNYQELNKLEVLNNVIIKQTDIFKNPDASLLLKNKKNENLFVKLYSTNSPLSKIADVVCGLTPYRINKGKPKQTIEIVKGKLFDSDNKKDETYRKYLMGRDFNRYLWQIEKARWISYGNWLAEPRYAAPFDEPVKLIIRQTSDKIIAHIDENNKYLSLKNVHNLKITKNNLDYKFLLTILNSKLLDWWYQQLIPEKGRVFAEVKVVNLKKLPIKYTSKQEPFIEKANKMLTFNKQLQEKKVRFLNRVVDNFALNKISKKIDVFYETDFKIFVTELKKQKIKLSLVQQDEWEEYFYTYKDLINQLQDDINTTDKEIDQIVYKLYELTEEEIEIVEKNI